MKRLIYLMMILFSISCHTMPQEYKEYVNKKLNSKIKLPENIILKQHHDSNYIKQPLTFIQDSLYRITTYIYGDCYSCVEDLIKWKKIITQFQNTKVRFLFFIYAEIYPTFEIINEKNIHFGYPIIYDLDNQYVKYNKIPDNKLLNTFLINPKGKIIIIGNPIISEKILDLYKKEIYPKF